MSDARRHILDDIRGSLGRGALPEDLQNALRARLSEPEQGTRPAFDQDPVARFMAKLQAVSGTVDRVAVPGDVPAAIQRYLDRHRLDARMVASGDALPGQFDWPASWQVERRPARSEDRVSVTGAFAAIAETGTLAFLSGADSPTTLKFLPDDHLVVVRSDQIVPHIEDFWCLLKKQLGNEPAAMPRTVNLVTGPSRTADVEQTIQLGAHGPRRLHVVLVEK